MSDREEQIRSLFPLVKRIAHRIHALIGGCELDDLIGDGSFGLIRAVDSFDPSYGLPLMKYARRVIVGAMLNGIRRLDPVSERVRRVIREAERERYALASELQHLPSMLEMEARIPDLARARYDLRRATPVRLDAPHVFGGYLEVPSTFGDPQAELVVHAERAQVHAAIARLPQRERRVILGHYFGRRPMRVLGKELRISPQRASQLHITAIARLRRTLVTRP